MSTTAADSPAPLPRMDIGLALAGAVSGGAYIAGALAFVVEALDAWQDARARGDADAPLHDSVLCSVAGASSGSLTAAALTAMLDREVPVVREGTPEAVAGRHPLYQAWVNATDISDLLGTTDAAMLPVASLLDAKHLDGVARRAMEVGMSLAPRRREWLASPLRVDFALTNLRGVPYRLQTASGGAGMAAHTVEQVMHADCVRHAVLGLGPHPAAPCRPGERRLRFPQDPAPLWSLWGREFAQVALASAAYPLVLAPRTIGRPVAELDQQGFGLPYTRGTVAAWGRPSVPAWSAANPVPVGDYRFAAIDGGITNNAPFDLVRDALSNIGPEMPARTGVALLIIDPTTAAQAPGPSEAATLGLFGWLGPALSALLAQVKLRPADLLLDPRFAGLDRFVLTPSARPVNTLPDGPPPSSDTAADGIRARRLAGSFLGGFGGYLHRALRRHDYLVGRCDAQRWLMDGLVLPADHPLFSRWTPEQRSHHDPGQCGRLPIIPLVRTLHPLHAGPEPRPDWPAGSIDLRTLRPLLVRRLDVVCRSVLPRSAWRWAWLALWRLLLRRWLVYRLSAAVRQALAAHDLD